MVALRQISAIFETPRCKVVLKQSHSFHMDADNDKIAVLDHVSSQCDEIHHAKNHQTKVRWVKLGEQMGLNGPDINIGQYQYKAVLGHS